LGRGISSSQGLLGAIVLFIDKRVASLAETIVKWKGFFQDALAFYHQVISEPLRKLFLELGLRIISETANYLVILVLLTSAFVRMRFIGKKNKLEGDWNLTVGILLAILNATVLIAMGETPTIWYGPYPSPF